MKITIDLSEKPALSAMLQALHIAHQEKIAETKIALEQQREHRTSTGEMFQYVPAPPLPERFTIDELALRLLEAGIARALALHGREIMMSQGDHVAVTYSR